MLNVINCGIPKLERLCLAGMLSLTNLLCFLTIYLLLILLIERESVYVKHLVHEAYVDNVVVQDTSIAKISLIVDGSSIIECSSVTVHPPQCSITIDRATIQNKLV